MKVKKFLVIICVLWMGFIFYNSSSSGSVSNKSSFAVVNFFRSEKSKIESSTVAESKQNTYSKLPVTKRDKLFNTFVRKNAHAFEYLVLSILVSTALFVNNKKGKAVLVYIMFICLLLAVLDEYNQKFSINRTSSVGDVLIDFGGSLIGLALFYIFYYGRRAISRLQTKRE